jgi:hypothetical protein
MGGTCISYLDFVRRKDEAWLLLSLVRGHDVFHLVVGDDGEEDERQHRDDQEEKRRWRDAERAGEVLPTLERSEQHRSGEQAKVLSQLQPRQATLELEAAIIILEIGGPYR